MDFLAVVDLEKEYEANSGDSDGNDLIVDLFEAHFGPCAQVWDLACWFHLTRVPLGTTFSEGILPLDLALDRIWQTLNAILGPGQKAVKLQELRAAGLSDYLYNLKTQSSIHFGPFAMLVRESAFHAEAMWNHDYLRIPEIIEDICNDYERRFRERIHEEVSAGLRPCVVKFEVAEDSGESLLAPVLHYCWCKARREELHLHANTCFDGRGQTVPHSAIRKFEFLEREKAP